MKDAMCSIPARFVAEQVGQRTTQLRAMQNEGTLVDAVFFVLAAIIFAYASDSELPES